jgi:hypothetical protein
MPPLPAEDVGGAQLNPVGRRLQLLMPLPVGRREVDEGHGRHGRHCPNTRSSGRDTPIRREVLDRARHHARHVEPVCDRLSVTTRLRSLSWSTTSKPPDAATRNCSSPRGVSRAGLATRHVVRRQCEHAPRTGADCLAVLERSQPPHGYRRRGAQSRWRREATRRWGPPSRGVWFNGAPVAVRTVRQIYDQRTYDEELCREAVRLHLSLGSLPIGLSVARRRRANKL